MERDEVAAGLSWGCVCHGALWGARGAEDGSRFLWWHLLPARKNLHFLLAAASVKMNFSFVSQQVVFLVVYARWFWFGDEKSPACCFPKHRVSPWAEQQHGAVCGSSCCCRALRFRGHNMGPGGSPSQNPPPQLGQSAWCQKKGFSESNSRGIPSSGLEITEL